jgi:hypothetical protein
MKKMIIYIIIGAIVVLFVLVGGVFGYKYLIPLNNITQAKEFTGSDGSFSFSYPDFKNWRSTDDGAYNIYYYYDQKDQNLFNKVIITKIERPRKNTLASVNKNGAFYLRDNEEGTVEFQDVDFGVNIAVLAGNQEGFSIEAVLDEIVKTFKFINLIEIKINEPVNVDGMTIELKNVQQATLPEIQQTAVSLFIKPSGGEGSDFSTTILAYSSDEPDLSEKYYKSRVITAYGYEITIVDVNPYEPNQQIEVIVTKKK